MASVISRPPFPTRFLARRRPVAGVGFFLPVFYIAYLVFLHYAALPWLNSVLTLHSNAISPLALGLNFLGAQVSLFNIGIYLSFFMGNAVVLLLSLVFVYRQFGPSRYSSCQFSGFAPEFKGKRSHRERK